ncbi:MAG TPA: flagellar hook-basal body protein [Bacillota bacterium]|nr:flagellar hook-basal body protein [Candidatus Fermentithermobacillaceae bacterium]HOB30301.1 flagellar hook-basal body protein [Bacillota bacterium]HOK64090.1 flagellar hook-basal body protein [Bacillota bacterium]HOL11599.1 flagellar hook-basal body protein [Bacillota bacterium]HOQ02727.1 flagellar hook-basal body protein [Bacillota bacterium]
MIRGILSATTAMRAQVLNQEIIANNLSNADTVAYQEDKVTFTSFRDVLMHRMEFRSQPVPVGWFSNGTVAQDIVTSTETGPIQNTDNPLDIALPPGAYLAVETPQGTRYTRMGDLRVKDGYLTVSGYTVLGINGPIQVENYKTCYVSEDGTVFAGDDEIGKLALYSFTDGANLRKIGNSLFSPEGSGGNLLESPSLTVGALEGSTIDPVYEMASLITSLRSYEAAQKIIQAHDETLDQAINRVGRV